jgi:hypothetical protein
MYQCEVSFCTVHIFQEFLVFGSVSLLCSNVGDSNFAELAC